MNSKRREYIAPTVAIVGTIAEVTLHHACGNFLDQSFPAGTPKGALTCSG